MVCGLTCVGLGLGLTALAVWAIRWYMKGPTSGTDNPKRLDGKVVVITGGNGGIGRETTKDMARRGATVIILCRSLSRARQAIAEILKEIADEGSARGKVGTIEVRELDLSSLASVRRCAEDLLKTVGKVDILINNAGVAGLPQIKTEDGNDMVWGTNQLGPFLLTNMLLPALRRSAKEAEAAKSDFRPRVVIVSALAHVVGRIDWDDINWNKPGFSDIVCYSTSKLANIMFSAELSRRVASDDILVCSLHPGVIATDLAREYDKTWYGKILMPVHKFLIKTPLDGAQTTIFCAVDDSVKTGRYYSDCRDATSSLAKKATIVEDQQRLWKVCEEMVGLKSK